MKEIIDLINKRKEELLLVVNYFNDDLDFLDSVLVNNNYSKLAGLMELDYFDVLVGYLISVSDRFSAREIIELLHNFDFVDFLDELDKENMDVFEFFYGNNNRKIKQIKKKLDSKGNKFNLDSIKLLEDVYGEELLRILIIFSTIEEMKIDYQVLDEEFDDVLSELIINERVSSKKKNKCYSYNLKLRYNIDKIVKDLSVIENKYNELNTMDKKRKREARKANSNYDRLLVILNDISVNNVITSNLFNNLINLVEDDDILRELLIKLDKILRVQFDEYNREYLKLSSDSEVSVQAIFRKYNIDFNDLPCDIKNRVFNLNQGELIKFLDLISLYVIDDFKVICYILGNSSVEIMNYLDIYVKDGIVTRNFLLNNLIFFSLDGFKDFSKKVELFRQYGINPMVFIDNLDIYLILCDKIKNNLDILKLYNLLDGINKLDCYALFECDNLCIKIDLLLELGYEKLLECNVGLLNVDMNNIRKLYILKSLGMLPVEEEEVVNILTNKEYLSYVDDTYVFNIVDYRIDTNLISDNIVDEIIDSCGNGRVLEINGVYLSKNRIIKNLKKLENVNINKEEKICYALVKGAILTEDEYNAIISNKDIIIKKLSI